MPESRGQRAAARLQSSVDEMLRVVTGLPQDLISWQPAADVWSVMDILCHVQEFVPYWTAQALLVSERQETWGRTHTDPDRLAAVTSTAARRVSDVQQAIREGAAQSAAILSRLSDAQLDAEAASKNPRWGTKPAQFIVDHLLIEHVEKHIGQIKRNVQQYQERVSP